MDLLKSFLELIVEFFKDKEIKITAPKVINADVKSPSFNRNRSILLKAHSQLGVKEALGSKNDPQVVEYLAFGGSESNKAKYADSTPWCAGFVGWVLEKAGLGSMNSLMARSYEKWGVSSKADPLPGDIVTFWRGSIKAGTGHVAFFIKKVGFNVYVLGGNQSDEVNVARFSMDRMTDIRRSSKALDYTQAEREELLKIAENIMQGKKIDTSGAVV